MITDLLIAAVLVAVFGARFGMAADSFALVTLCVFGALRLLRAAYRPYKRCPNPWCSTRKPRDADGDGYYRLRLPCPCCGGSGHWRRAGARLIGRG